MTLNYITSESNPLILLQQIINKWNNLEFNILDDNLISYSKSLKIEAKRLI